MNIADAKRALGFNLRRRDNAGRARVAEVLDSHPNADWLLHDEVARMARTTREVVRAVRRERGETLRPTPIGARLLSGMEPRHVEALRRLAAAHARGSDMTVRAILGGAEMQQLLTAAKETP